MLVYNVIKPPNLAGVESRTNPLLPTGGPKDTESHHPALQRLQDAVGLAHSYSHFLHFHHGAIQCCIPLQDHWRHTTFGSRQCGRRHILP